jgi:hypothetical protein
MRYDRLMDLGWKVLLPLGLFWVLATGFAVVLRTSTDQATVLRIAGVGAGVALLLYLAAPLFARRPRGGGDGSGGDDEAEPAGRDTEPSGEIQTPSR